MGSWANAAENPSVTDHWSHVPTRLNRKCFARYVTGGFVTPGHIERQDQLFLWIDLVVFQSSRLRSRFGLNKTPETTCHLVNKFKFYSNIPFRVVSRVPCPKGQLSLSRFGKFQCYGLWYEFSCWAKRIKPRVDQFTASNFIRTFRFALFQWSTVLLNRFSTLKGSGLR